MVSSSQAYVRSLAIISHQQILVEQQRYTPPGICSLPLIFLHLSSKEMHASLIMNTILH